MTTLYQGLLRAKRKVRGEKPETAFFNEHYTLLSPFECYRHLMKANSPFERVRANIVIRALLNKKQIESAYLKALKEESDLPLSSRMEMTLEGLPSLLLPEGKNYVPVLPRSLLGLYSKDFEKLAEAPYSELLGSYEGLLLDPFDLYGTKIFASSFAPSLFPIYGSPLGLSAYEEENERLYMIDNQGRLETEIALFDKRLASVDKKELPMRLYELSRAYYENDHDLFLQLLVEGRLVSGELIRSLGKNRR